MEQRILDGLAAGTPLTLICEPKDMPAWQTVYDWMADDAEFSRGIARARDAGFDRIALDALAIADEVSAKDTITTKFGDIPNKEWLLRSKLRVETRLKLLSKWDPKRYGDRVAQEISGPGGGPIQTEGGGMRLTEQDEETVRRIAAIRDGIQKPTSEPS